ncbi:kinase-like domain-containing protein [Rhizophagus irregularis DAOM 181602=DAOM 197198]|nr:kinase-like domain-containing protein [Rhizophagus irregularis DAOM 181602=DAOM 197198]
MLARVQAREVTLKLCNSQNMIDEFLNKAKAYYKISQIYGISQESITKDYIMVLQEKCDERYCENSSWKDGPLEYDSNNKMLARVQAREVTLKLCKSQNMINDFLNKVEVYVKIFNVYGITQYPDSKDYVMVLHQEEYVKGYCKTCIEEYTDMKHKRCEGGFAKVYSAEWKNGPLHYDKEWKRGSCKQVALKCLIRDPHINRVVRFLAINIICQLALKLVGLSIYDEFFIMHLLSCILFTFIYISGQEICLKAHPLDNAKFDV